MGQTPSNDVSGPPTSADSVRLQTIVPHALEVLSSHTTSLPLVDGLVPAMSQGRSTEARWSRGNEGGREAEVPRSDGGGEEDDDDDLLMEVMDVFDLLYPTFS